MVKLFRADLTPTGRPVLLPGEVERGMLDKIDVLFYGRGGVEEHPAEEYKDGYVVLTNYRLIWLLRDAAAGEGGGGGGVPCHLPLPAVSDVEHRSGMLVKAARLKLMVRLDGGRHPTADSRVVDCVAPLKLVCRGPSPDTLHSQLQRALDGRAWAAAPPGLLQQLCPAAGLPPGGGGAAAGRVAAGPLAAGLQRASAAAPSEPRFQPDWAIVEGLVAASFPRLQAVNAVAATRNAGVQQAVEWILDHQGSPLLDQPSPFLDAAASGGGGGSGGGGSAWTAGPSSSSAQPAYAAWPPPHAGPASGGATFANPLLGGSGGWDALGGGASSGSSWEVLSGGGSGAAGSGLLPAALGGSGGTALPGPGLQYGRPGGVGVAAILKREEQKAAATETAMDAAFADLDQLMRKAGEMVQLAQYFRERVARPGGEGGEEELDAETALDLLNLGIVTPVTKESAGSLYHQELARQLADFLRQPLERAAGMMPLPDAYCLYNRARGTELISPDDLLAAVKLFPKIRAPFTLREFASGVKVIQAASHSDDAVCARLAEMAAPRPPIATPPGDDATPAELGEPEAALLGSLGPALTRTEVAAALGVPVPVAGEHLKTAEGRGVLCRDEGPQGLRFFRNFFADPGLQAAAAS